MLSTNLLNFCKKMLIVATLLVAWNLFAPASWCWILEERLAWAAMGWFVLLTITVMGIGMSLDFGIKK